MNALKLVNAAAMLAGAAAMQRLRSDPPAAAAAAAGATLVTQETQTTEDPENEIEPRRRLVDMKETRREGTTCVARYSVCVATVFLWKAAKKNVNVQELQENVEEVFRVTGRSGHVDLDALPFCNAASFCNKGISADEDTSRSVGLRLTRIRTVHGKLFEAETGDKIREFFDSIRSHRVSCMKVEVVYENEVANIAKPSYSNIQPVGRPGSHHALDIGGVIVPQAEPTMTCEKTPLEYLQPGGLRQGDRVLKMLYTEVSQKLTLDNIEVMNPDEVIDAQRFLESGNLPVGSLKPRSGKVLFIVSRSSSCCSGVLSFLPRIPMTAISLAQVLYAMSETPEEEPQDFPSMLKRNWVEILATGFAVSIMGWILSRPSSNNKIFQIPGESADPATPGGMVHAAAPMVHAPLFSHYPFSDVSWAVQDDTRADKTYSKEDLLTIKSWTKLEMVLAALAIFGAMAIPFIPMLKKLEKAGRTGDNQEIRFGTATFIGVGLGGKALRAGTVLLAFSDLPTATAFFLHQEAVVIGLTVVFSLLSGVLGLDFRPTNWLSAWFYLIWIVGEVAFKCWLTFYAIKKYKEDHPSITGSYVQGLKKKIMGLGKYKFIIFFISMHLTLDTVQQIITGLAVEIAGVVVACMGSCIGSSGSLSGCFCVWLTESLESCVTRLPSRLRQGLFSIPHMFEWVAHSGFTLPVLNGGWGPLYYFTRVMKADKAAAGHVASEMLLAQLKGNY